MGMIISSFFLGAAMAASEAITIGVIVFLVVTIAGAGTGLGLALHKVTQNQKKEKGNSKRDEGEDSPLPTYMILRIHEYMGKKAIKHIKQLDWLATHSYDKATGHLTILNPKHPGELTHVYNVLPTCESLHDGGAYDYDGKRWPLNYWTPNGTLSAWIDEGRVEAEWLVEMVEAEVSDCRGQMTEDQRRTLLTLSPEQMAFVDECHRRMDKKGGHHHSRDVMSHDLVVADHFSSLPALGASEMNHAANGATLLLSSMNNSTLPGQAALMHVAMSTLFKRARTNKRWLGANTPLHVMVDSTIDAVVDAADAEHKAWVHTLALGGAQKALRLAGEAGHAGKDEALVLNALFDRAFPK